MLAVLFKLVPLRDYLYAALALALVIWYNIHVHNLEVSYAARQEVAITSAVSAASEQAETKANAQIDSLNKFYAVETAKMKANYETLIQGYVSVHANDLARLQHFAATENAKHSDALLDSPGSRSASADSRNQGVTGLGSIPGELALELADALRLDDAALNKCYEDRDILTGK